MLGMSNLSVNGCAFGDVSTGVDVEGPATERGARCSVGNATGRVSFWLSSGVCDGDYDGSVGLIRCLVGRDEEMALMNVCEYTLIVFPPFSPAPVDRPWYTIADRFAGDFSLASMFINSSRDLFTSATAMVWLQNLYDAYLGQDESHVNLLPFVREGVTTCMWCLACLACNHATSASCFTWDW